MPTTVNRSDFVDALRALRPLSTKTILPVLANVKLYTSDDALVIEATNVEAWGRRRVPFRGDALEPTTAIAKSLTDFVGAFTGDDVALALDKAKLRVTSGRQKASVATIDSDNFPTFPILDGDAHSLTLPRSVFERVATKVAANATPAKERVSRPIFTVVNVNGDGERIRFAAADNYRIGVLYFEHPAQIELNIPVELLSQSAKVCAGDVIVTSTSRGIHFAGTEGGEVVGRLMEGQYPTLENVIPTTFRASVRVEREAFEANVRLATVASEFATILEVTDDGMRMRANDPENEFETVIDAQVSPVEVDPNEENAETELRVALQPKYIKDALALLGEASAVDIHWSKSMAPVVIGDPEDSSVRCVIMPVRKPNG